MVEFQHGELLVWSLLLSPSRGYPILENFEESAQEPTARLNISQQLSRCERPWCFSLSVTYFDWLTCRLHILIFRYLDGFKCDKSLELSLPSVHSEYRRVIQVLYYTSLVCFFWTQAHKTGCMLQVQSKQFESYRLLYRRIQSIMVFFSTYVRCRFQGRQHLCRGRYSN